MLVGDPGVAVDVLKLLDFLLRSADVEVVIPTLPEVLACFDLSSCDGLFDALIAVASVCRSGSLTSR